MLSIALGIVIVLVEIHRAVNVKVTIFVANDIWCDRRVYVIVCLNVWVRLVVN